MRLFIAIVLGLLCSLDSAFIYASECPNVLYHLNTAPPPTLLGDSISFVPTFLSNEERAAIFLGFSSGQLNFWDVMEGSFHSTSIKRATVNGSSPNLFDFAAGILQAKPQLPGNCIAHVSYECLRFYGDRSKDLLENLTKGLAVFEIKFEFLKMTGRLLNEGQVASLQQERVKTLFTQRGIPFELVKDFEVFDQHIRTGGAAIIGIAANIQNKVEQREFLNGEVFVRKMYQIISLAEAKSMQQNSVNQGEGDYNEYIRATNADEIMRLDQELRSKRSFSGHAIAVIGKTKSQEYIAIDTAAHTIRIIPEAKLRASFFKAWLLRSSNFTQN